MGSSVVFQAGETALLPCDISVPPNSGGNDGLTLVMWYREDVGSPIYSIGNEYLLLLESSMEKHLKAALASFISKADS